MKSKSSTYIIVVVAIVVIIALIYFFAVKGSGSASATTTPGLVSANTGTANAIPTSSTSAAAPGSQVVALLRNLSVIQLDDSVFSNPSYALLQDLSIQLPPITNHGRRNPFAVVGSDAAAPTTGSVTFQIQTPSSTSKK